MTRTILLSTLITIGLSAATLTQGERDRAMSELHASSKMLTDAVAGLSDKQLNYKAGPDRWSIAEVVEHLANGESFIFAMYKQVAGGASVAGAKAAMSDEELLKFMRNREKKFSAPEPIRPNKTFKSVAEALAAFKERRTNTISYVETTQDQDLRLKMVPQQGMDAYQVFLMIAGHTQRHVAQIEEVKQTAGYPKK